MKKPLSFVMVLCMVIALLPAGIIPAYAADSSYSAQFSYNGKQYSAGGITGTQEIQLSTILTPLEINGTVTAASVSEGQGMTVTTETLTLTKAFGTGWLKVTAGGTEHQITITSTPDSISVVLYGTLSFNANGGSGIMDGQPVQEYTQTVLPDCAFTPPDGYEFDQWEINGARYNAGATYTFGQTTTAKAIWKLREGVHSITAVYNNSDGDVVVSPTMAAADETVTVTVQPVAGKAVDSISYSYGSTAGQALSDGEGGAYTFSMPGEDTTVSVTFKDATKEPIAYVDEDGNSKNCTDYSYIRSTDTSWTGWVVASQNLTFNSRVTVSGTVNLILMDGKTLTVTGGIQACAGTTLNIYAQSGNTGALIAGNEQNSYNAGIGGSNNNGTAGTININGGIITAVGGYESAGIGGAPSLGKAGTITIRGNADVTATAGKGGAAIGTAPGGLGGSVTISGNAKVNAIGVNASAGAGAGIGGGRNGYCDNIVITGGTVNATCCGSNCAAIGTGSGTGKGGTVSISGGNVTATATASNGVGIGGKNVTITISGSADVTATGTKNNAGIGGLYESEYGNTINIEGGTVKAYAGTNSGAAAIGSGNKARGKTTVTLSGGVIEAHGDNTYGVGIGGGNTGTASEEIIVNISGGNITATGRVGIGTANASEATQTVSISGGTVTATGAISGGNPGAAIGQGNNSKSPTMIVITGGTVTANGTGNGIGAGANSNKIPTVKLRWTGANDEFTAISYVGNVTLEKSFMSKSNNSEVFAAGALTDNSVIENKTLIPTDTSKFAVIISDISYGSITPNPRMQTAGQSVTLTIQPVNGGEMNANSLSVTYTDGSETHSVSTVQDSTDSNKYTFTMPGADVTVTATFTSAWQKLQNQINSGTTSIILTGDVVACDGEPALQVPVDKTVTIDLNGHKIDRHLTYGIQDGCVMKIRGTLTIADNSSGQNGIITGGNNKGSNTASNGGGILVEGAGKVTLECGSITGNTSQGYGGGVCLGSTSKFFMNGGSVTGNTSYYGAGIAAKDNSALSISGGTISGNTASYSGGGVNLNVDCGFIMTGGEIKNNTAANKSGGINYESRGAIKFGGSATVTNNTVGGKPYNVHIPANKTLTIESVLTGTIGVTTATAPTADTPILLTSGLSGKGTTTNFTSDKATYAVDVNTSGEAVLKLPDHIHNFTYSATDATITATCSVDGCPLTGGQAALTINAPASLTYDGKAKAATITSDTSVLGTPSIAYKQDTTALDAAPVNAGTYTASITLGEATASVEYTITPAALTNVSVAQNGKLTYTGEVLTPQVTTAATAVNEQTVTFTYSKTQDGTYGAMPTVTNVSDGGTIYYKASAPNHNDAAGSFTVTVDKASQTAPAAPTKASATITSITLTAIENGEYKMDDGEWQASPIFTGLTMNKSYTFRQRYAADENHNVSVGSNEAVIRTNNHSHEWGYEAQGATITATCGNTDGGHGTPLTATLTINAPTLTTYGETGKDANATITGSIDGVTNPDIVYKKGNNTLNAAPTDAGTYTASITLGQATASVEYTIAQATTTITENPTPGAITYGQKLANSTLTGGTASMAGSFAWKDSKLAPAVSDSQTTEYDVVFTPTNGNYGTAVCKVKLTVNKADSTVTKAPTAKTLTYTGSAQALVAAGTATGGTMQYALGTATEATQPYTTSIPTATEAGTYYVWYKVVGDANHSDSTPVCLPVTIAALTEPVITGADLVLNGSLDFRFYVALPTDFDSTGAHMVLTIRDRNYDIPFDDAKTSADTATQGQKIFSCPVYSIEMAVPVEAVFHYTKGGEDKTTTRTASIKDYLDALDAQGGQSAQLSRLIAAVRNYGHYIQPYLARLHDFTVGAGGYAEMPAATASLEPATAQELEPYKTVWTECDRNLLESVTYYDTFDTSTFLNVQVKLKSARTLTATVGGAAVKVTELGGNVYAVRTPGIAANSLGTPAKVVFYAGSTVICDIDVSALTYVRAVLASRNKADEKAALTAFYNYYVAAEAYGSN